MGSAKQIAPYMIGTIDVELMATPHNMPKRVLLLIFVLFIQSTSGVTEELCIYQNNQGVITQSNSKSQIPKEYQNGARCVEVQKKGSITALQMETRPEEISLGNTTGRDTISTSLGTMNVRWARSVEKSFGRTPMRALAEAAQSASRALKRGGFPPALSSLNKTWSVVFMDEKLPEAQIPMQLISNCHPGWYTPPGNIYIVGQRVASGCGSGNQQVDHAITDGRLAEVLIHEIGHGVEFELLHGAMGNDRLRAESFATWFENYASEFSSVIDSEQKKETQRYFARLGLQRQALNHFDGSAEAYAAGSLIFSAIVKRRGIGGLVSVYNVMDSQKLSLYPAIKEAILWDEDHLLKEVSAMIE